MRYQAFAIGDSCVYCSLGENLSVDLSKRVIAAYRLLKQSGKLKSLGVTDIVPAYTGVALYFDNPSQSQSVTECLETILTRPIAKPQETREHTIPVVYNGLDIERACSFTGLALAELVKIHTAAKYIVAMIGFLPNFPYLLGLDRRLHIPRLDSPRVTVPAGSVAIGGAQTGVYPRSSPGGWNIVGTCNPDLLLDLSPGDLVSFVEVRDAT
jgi:KipI family sensor histidine kinase inhibitor